MKTPIYAALRTLDAAPEPLAESELRQARATLETIVSTPRLSHRENEPGATPARRHRARWALVPAAVVAVVLASAVVQNDGIIMAYASWTPTPSDASAQDLAVAEAVCEEKVRNDDTIDGDEAEVVLAERRGDFVALVYRTEEPDLTAACLIHNPAGTADFDGARFGIGGSSGPALQPPPTGFTQGAVFQYDHGAASLTDGAVGARVTGVTIHAGTTTVEATVENGRYVAWWPGSAFEDEPTRPSGRGGPRLNLSYDLTLADGTVMPDADPSRPA